MGCANSWFNGWGECAGLLEAMQGFVLQEKGETWTDAQAQTPSVWHTAIADDDFAVRSALSFPLLSFENTTNDVTINEAPSGIKSQGQDSVPSGVIYLNAGLCDYQTLKALKGTTFQFIPFFQGNSFWMSRKSDGTLKGFSCTVGTRNGLPPEDKNQSYPLDIFFSAADEFDKIALFSDYDFIYSDILDFAPAALNIRVTTPYAVGGEVVVYAEKRGTGEPMLGLDAVTNWPIRKSRGVPTMEVTVVVEIGAGYYTLTIKQDVDGTPADLGVTDYVYIQAEEVAAPYLTYISAAYKISGVEV